MKKKRIISILSAIAIIIIVSITVLLLDSRPLHKSEQGKNDSEYKIGYVISGSVDDSRLSREAYNGLMAVKDESGAFFSMRENIAADQLEDDIRQYAEENFDIVVLLGEGYEEIGEKLAGDLPDLNLVLLDSNIKNDKNLGSLSVEYRTTGFIKGMIAAYMTKNNVVAAIGYKEDQPTIKELVGYENGVKYIDADIQVYGEYLDSKGENAKGGDLLLEFAGYGADVVLAAAGTRDQEIIEAAEGKKIYSLGAASSLLEEYTSFLLGATSYDIEAGVGDIVRMAMQEGSFGDNIALEYQLDYNQALKSKIPAAGQKKIDGIIEKLKGGELKIDELVPMGQ